MLSGSVVKALDLLSLFSRDTPEWGVTDVATQIGMPKSTAHMLLNSLASRGLLRRTANSRYRLGWRLFELSQVLVDTTEFRVEASRVMHGLLKEWQEIVHLGVLDDAQVVYLAKLQPTPCVRVPISRVGARLPAHASGLGKMLLASAPWDRVRRLFEHQGMLAMTPNTITDLDEFQAELERIAERGIAYDEEEICIGLCCVAAPIRDHRSEVIAALSVSAPAVRFEAKRDELTAAVVEAAERISQNVGAPYAPLRAPRPLALSSTRSVP